MILEGLVTTLNPDGSPHLAPMGPLVECVPFDSFVLRPFPESNTGAHLQATRTGILHFTDDVYVLAAAAIGRRLPLPKLRRADAFPGFILQDTCYWYAFRVSDIVVEEPRNRLHCQVVASGRERDFVGFCRAQHAVVEAAILATRLKWLSLEEVQAQFHHLRRLVEKTAGPREEAAFSLLEDYLKGHAARASKELTRP